MKTVLAVGALLLAVLMMGCVQKPASQSPLFASVSTYSASVSANSSATPAISIEPSKPINLASTEPTDTPLPTPSLIPGPGIWVEDCNFTTPSPLATSSLGQNESGYSVGVGASGCGHYENGTWNCGNDDNCGLSQRCVDFVCTDFACSGYCVHLEDHQCKVYECCADTDCNIGSKCFDNECRFSVESPENKIAFIANGSLFLMNDNGTGIGKLTVVGREANYVTWAPDGKQIVFGRYASTSINLDGTNRSYLDGIGGHPSWSRDGTKLAFWIGESYDSIRVLNVQTGRITNVSHHLEFANPVFSPDGKQIAYEQWSFIWNPTIINVMNADGSDDKFLTPGINPSWSPEGKMLVFENGGIQIVNVETKEIRFLIAGSSPSWSPKGDTIIYARPEGGLSIINPDGSGQANLTNFGGYPAWSPIQT